MLSFTVGEQQVDLHLALPFSWVIFYFGALFVALGEAVYFLFCPDIVRKWRSYRQFEEERGSADYLIQLAEKIGDPQLVQYVRDGTRSYSAPETYQSSARAGWFWSLRDHYNKSRVGALRTCQCCYAAGLLAFLLILFQNTYFVVTFLGD